MNPTDEISPQRVPLNERLAYSVEEFGAACGRSYAWAYRQLYAGHVQAIDNGGRLLIPHTEVKRFLGTAKPYTPKPKAKRKT